MLDFAKLGGNEQACDAQKLDEACCDSRVCCKRTIHKNNCGMKRLRGQGVFPLRIHTETYGYNWPLSWLGDGGHSVTGMG